MSEQLDIITGAFSYTGREIARQLLPTGHTVKTLTRRGLSESPFGDRVQPLPLNFEDPPALAASLEGAHTLYNTYWVRFAHGDVEFSDAVRNTTVLIEAALAAGVRRFVHVSITKPHSAPSLPYFKGKALLEETLIASGLSYGIVRPTVVFGRGDVFINNVAWILRHFPFVGIPGDGQYGIQPVHVDDVARIAVELGATSENLIRDAAGPETFTWDEFVAVIGAGIGCVRPLVHVPVPVALAMAKAIGVLVHDVVVNRQELAGLMANLVVSDLPPSGEIRLTEWIRDHAETLGQTYSSELNRNFRRPSSPWDDLTHSTPTPKPS